MSGAAQVSGAATVNPAVQKFFDLPTEPGKRDESFEILSEWLAECAKSSALPSVAMVCSRTEM